MGYYTNFTLDFEPEEPELVKYLEKAADNNHYEESNLYYAWTHNLNRVKWYGYKEDLISISKKFPNVLFKLYGKGEEDDDIWVAYAKGGAYEYHQAMIFYPSSSFE